MQYREDRYGNKISVLGFGCMRFTKKGSGFDAEKAERELMAAYEAGVNYYDTAYMYAGSEALIGEIFERRGIREKIRIATKLPQHIVRKAEDPEKFLQEELKRLRTGYVDYYLMHLLNDVGSWRRLCDLGIEEWLRDKKERGIIRQVGFSYHGNADGFRELLDAYDWDMCQVQYNYLDENSQAGRTGYEAAACKGIALVIMEPLRGGKLANQLPKEAVRMFEQASKERGIDRSPAAWGLHWLWDQPGVTCVLSGMNSLEMVEENCREADKAKAGTMTEADQKVLRGVVREIRRTMKVDCTGCRYCMPCPQNVDIPGTFAAYNNRYTDGWFSAEKEYMMCTVMRNKSTAAGNCIGCGACEKHCPQHIAIRKELKNAAKVLEGPIYQIARRIVPLVFRY
ncbi:MAG: aldo/keto reductase [Mogibacterium sp.]|nr:aldo/keto reductase [Mogibacterium sp.]